MIQKLYIKNYAIISEIEINFHEQLTVMTGETGAGKSIILDALSLILGDRADSSVILDDNSKCIIEGTFDISKNSKVKDKLTEREFDCENSFLILRREINSQGKSRAFINDTPCTLSDLNYLNIDLVDINKQFDNQQIKNESYIINWIDIYAENTPILNKYSIIYKEYISHQKELQNLLAQKLNIEKERDYIQFQIQEIQNMNFKDNEIETLEEQIKIIENQSDINKLIHESSFLLSESEHSIIQSLQKVNSNFSHLTGLGIKAEDLRQRIVSVIEELKDIDSDISDNESHIEFTESEFQELAQRFSDSQRLLKKHNLNSTHELLLLLESLEEQNVGFSDLDKRIQEIERQLLVNKGELLVLAESLSIQRKNVIGTVSGILHDNMQKVGLSSAEIKLEIKSTDNLKSSGYDEINLLIDFNKTHQFLPLSKAGSGGELSRMLLAMKSVIGDKHDDTSFIFDEIDSAISGEVARQVAFLIRNISVRNQVIVLTHQPQMASKADIHYHLYKELNIDNQRNQTFIKRLDSEERINYIAQMMSGENISESSLNSAKEMIDNK